MDFCARCGQQAQPGQPFCARCGLALRNGAPGGGAPGGGPLRGGRARWTVAAGIVAAAVAAGAIVATVLVDSPGPDSTSALSKSPVQATAQAAAGPAGSDQAGSGQSGSGQSGSGQSGADQAGGGQAGAAGQAPEKAAAQGLSRLLTQSISERSAILSAFHDVDSCGSRLAADARTFQQAASSRRTLLARLGGLPAISALPSGLLQALNGAWQASVAADQDYAAWARDEGSRGCRVHDTANAHYQATIAPNHLATVDKTTFTDLWNPVAARYGLPTYLQDEL